MDLVGQSDQSLVFTKDYYFITKNYYFTTVSILVSAKQACYHYSDEKTTNKFTYKTSKKLIYSRFYFYCSCSKIIMAIETEMFRLLFLCHGKGVNLMELSMREKELLIMFGSERRLDTHKRLQNAIPYMIDSLYKVAATALWNKLYNNICDSQYVLMYWRTRAELSGIESNISRRAINNE